MSIQRKGKKQTPTQYAANCNRITKRRKVKCLDTNIIYDDVNSASKHFDVSSSMIQSVIKWKRNLKNGFKLVYLNEYSLHHNTYN
jgi:hypothetical protein